MSFVYLYIQLILWNYVQISSWHMNKNVGYNVFSIFPCSSALNASYRRAEWIKIHWNWRVPTIALPNTTHVCDQRAISRLPFCKQKSSE